LDDTGNFFKFFLACRLGQAIVWTLFADYSDLWWWCKGILCTGFIQVIDAFIRRRKMKKITLFLLLMFVVGCMTSSEQEAMRASKEREMTLGLAQKEIRVGMSQADVAAALGSPNIVSKDSEGNESWIYDKIATDVYTSSESGGISAGGGSGTLMGSWLLALSGQAQYSKSAGRVTQTQRTLTVVIKFDENGLVKTLSYHSSKF
jgi:outer membrane protein assembly factor BamE (lipoprotein component of BamABCDE complex)